LIDISVFDTEHRPFEYQFTNIEFISNRMDQQKRYTLR